MKIVTIKFVTTKKKTTILRLLCWLKNKKKKDKSIKLNGAIAIMNKLVGYFEHFEK